MRPAKQEKNAFVLRAERLTLRPSCALFKSCRKMETIFAGLCIVREHSPVTGGEARRAG